MDDVNAVLRITQDREHLVAAGQVERELVSALLRLSRDRWKDPRGTGDEPTPKGSPRGGGGSDSSNGPGQLRPPRGAIAPL